MHHVNSMFKELLQICAKFIDNLLRFSSNLIFIVKYSINTYVRYLNYALLVIAEMPNDELTGNHTLSLPPLYL